MSSNITNEIILSYLFGLYENHNTKLMELRDFAEKNKVPIILKDTEGLLIALMKLKKPSHVLEIGTAVGYSAGVIADACGCSVTTIESDEKLARIAESNIENLGLAHKIEVLNGEAVNVLTEIQKSVQRGKRDKYEVVFIDAAKSHYREFWDISRPLLARDSIIICDNVLMKGMTASDEFDTRGRYKTSIRRMRDFITYIKSQEGVETWVLPVGDGVSISIIE
ncbi:MAG: O-methyltransferase [Eubacteriales bacterium]|nr:O-methyltransferase [Eubacteriales bacterium]